MNVFDEFTEVVAHLEKHNIRYALVGGVAVAFYAEPRFTQDIDFLLDPNNFETVHDILAKSGYFESAKPWTFLGTAITLHRFIKVVDNDLMIVDILIAGDQTLLEIIANAIEARSEYGVALVARKADIIWLKKQRNSLQDQADIERLENEHD
jgi:hypothetical protein